MRVELEQIKSQFKEQVGILLLELYFSLPSKLKPRESLHNPFVQGNSETTQKQLNTCSYTRSKQRGLRGIIVMQ